MKIHIKYRLFVFYGGNLYLRPFITLLLVFTIEFINEDELKQHNAPYSWQQVKDWRALEFLINTKNTMNFNA